MSSSSPIDPTQRSRVLTLLFTDLVDSVGLKSRLGDADAAEIISAHHAAVREIGSQTAGREVLVAGDGCFLSFETPSQAVEFALRLQEFHSHKPGMPAVRIGIHMGEVTERNNPAGYARPFELEGLAVDIASRVQGLALPQQVLMSYPVFDNARQRLDSSQWNLPVEWRAHGRYIFQGADASLEIYEVGLKGVSPFKPPTGGSKARRDVVDDEESTLGWRPAQGLELPDRPKWVLIEKLGEGGFGDVWLAEHRKTRERHVIKFCYSPEHLRALKREVMLFRLLKETLGDRQDIARVLDYRFESKPYYLEMEFTGGNNLAMWLEERGSVDEVPLTLRLEIVAQIADAIAAAHSVGVLHKDIKPSNIMVIESSTQDPRIRMIDFGIGDVADHDLLRDKGITVTGLTEGVLEYDYPPSLTGTRLYMAPELVEGKPATTKSDIYSLGVLLYQMVSGKMGQTISVGWDRDIDDSILRDDIAACVDGDPDKRLNSAAELAVRLRQLPQRRAALDLEEKKQEERIKRRARSKRLRRMAVMAGMATLLLMLLLGMSFYVQMQKARSEETLRKSAEAARENAQRQSRKTQQALAEAQQAQYFGAIALAEASLVGSRFVKAQEVLLHEAPSNFMRREWGWLLAQTAPEDFALTNRNFYDCVFTPDGSQFVIGSRTKTGMGYIALFDSRTAKQVMELETNIRLVWSVDISPDGSYVATASSDKVVSVVDVKARKVVRRLKQNKGIVRDVAFSPDGKWLASCARDNTIRFWSLPDFQHERVIRLPNDKLTEIAFSPDSQYLVSGSLEGNIRVFDVTSGTEMCSLAGAKEMVLSVTFLANNKGIAAAVSDDKVMLFPWPPPEGVNSLNAYAEVRSESSYPAQVVSSPDGTMVYIGYDNGRIVKAESATGKEIMTMAVDQPLWKINLCRNGNRLLTTSRWSARLLDLVRLEDRCTVTDLPVGSKPTSGAIEMTAATVFSARDQTWRQDKEWRTSSGLSLVKTSYGKEFFVQSAYVIYSPDRTQFIRIDPETFRWEARSSQDKLLFEMDRHMAGGAVYSPDGRLVLVLYEKENSVVYRTDTWEKAYEIPRTDTSVVAMFTSDSQNLLVCDVDGTIMEFETTSGQPLRMLRGKGGGSGLSMDLSPSGRLLAVGLDQDRAVIIDLVSGDHLSTMTGHVRYVHAIKFAPDEERLATMSRDGTVKLWDTLTGRELVTIFKLPSGTVPLGIHFGTKGRMISVVTSDRRVVGTDVFPWTLDTYGDGDAPIEDRVELWKRRMRLDSKLTLEDLHSRP